MLLEITLLVAAGLGNLAWDVTGRRISARARRRERRARRSDSLPLPGPGEQPADPLAGVAGVAPEAFVDKTRVILEELDRVVDHFDLILLRAEAGESLVGDIVYVGAEGPRERGRELIEGWLAEVAELPAAQRERLDALGMPVASLEAMLAGERERCLWPHAGSSSKLLEATARDFERAVMLLVGFLGALVRAPGSPYR
ncbi:hypothetical protein G6O69_20695 [Pseudenhygromyxa sp. WMMC2535]|uniref:hypothetical protein n=1 Tax=Pseudenhygromyxa sp. WMMC2535 TaxID=2712867 RepID=UPI0015564446|nr:hypothetical protein [Pseudenhygromyxa sp. WMMC2535]NVB40273.1 hypothetical protein [Pseudenhygromyxa sp. WMMC2535]